MGYQTWIDYGYGVNASAIPDSSVEQLRALLNHAPQFRAQIEEWFTQMEIAEPTYENYMEYFEHDTLGLPAGLAFILSKVILEAEGIELLACSNFEGDQYLIYLPSYPWTLAEADKTLTQERIDEILTRYISILTDEPIEIDYQSVENGG